MQIQIEKEWLEGLLQIAERVKNEQDPQQLMSWTHHLIGYIESSKYILSSNQ